MQSRVSATGSSAVCLQRRCAGGNPHTSAVCHPTQNRRQESSRPCRSFCPSMQRLQRARPSSLTCSAYYPTYTQLRRYPDNCSAGAFTCAVHALTCYVAHRRGTRGLVGSLQTLCRVKICRSSTGKIRSKKPFIQCLVALWPAPHIASMEVRAKMHGWKTSNCCLRVTSKGTGIHPKPFPQLVAESFWLVCQQYTTHVSNWYSCCCFMLLLTSPICCRFVKSYARGAGDL